MIETDGSEGEGGGQILRTSLALSLVTAQPFCMERIRAKRQKPSLLRQHLTAVEAAKAVGCANAEGSAMNSQVLEFRPGPVTPGNYRFAVGTAGSATLVLQTVLPLLLTASGRSTLTLEGGTHNPFAPPFDFLVSNFRRHPPAAWRSLYEGWH
jgi:RNA 3'-terminal phosphate cyclase (ATP)